MVIRRQDMAITHEEADTIIICQIVNLTSSRVLVVADDTDIFVLLCHFVFHGNIKSHVMMISPIKGRAAIDINVTVEKNNNIMENILAAHGVTGCDTVATYFGIGKGVALKVLRSQKCSLSYVGDISSSLENATKQSRYFILSCYGYPQCETMTESRQKMWSNKVSRSICSAPKLHALPPTEEAFKENAARAHLQVAIWRNASEPHPPSLNPLNYGWTKQKGSDPLSPTMVGDNVELVPSDVLKMIKCSCESDVPCKTKRCGCLNANMACTEFCTCQGGEGCFNEKTRECLKVQEEDNDDF